MSFMPPAIGTAAGAAEAGGAKSVRLFALLVDETAQVGALRCACGRVAFHGAAIDHFFGSSAFFSQQDAHLSWPHLSQQSPPCVQHEEQSFVAFIFGCVSSASMGKDAKASAISANLSVIFMVIVFSLG